MEMNNTPKDISLDDDSNRGFPLSRRTLLRGAGAALALPWLEAMMPSRTQAEENDGKPPVDSPLRMAALFVPNGVRNDMWTPKETGREFELSPTLEPLENVKDQLLVLSNLWNQASNVGDGHYVKTSGFLTCTTINKSLGIDLNCNGRSMDQVAAESSAKYTPLPSLELGIDPVTTGVDTNVGYTRVYGSHIAWSGPQKPVGARTESEPSLRSSVSSLEPFAPVGRTGFTAIGPSDFGRQTASTKSRRFGPAALGRIPSIRSINRKTPTGSSVRCIDAMETSGRSFSRSTSARGTTRTIRGTGSLDARHDCAGISDRHDASLHVHVRKRS